MVTRALAALALCLGCASAPRPPNVVFILADDLGYGDLGAYGQKVIRTPHLDRLAAEGMRFRQFYAGSTVCAPSRAVLMTGRHTGRVSVRGNAPERALHELRPDEVTVAQVLQGRGYRTALVGKWGLGNEGSGSEPGDRGFDFFYGYLDQVHAHNYYPAFLYRDRVEEKLRNEVVPVRPDLAGRYVDDRAVAPIDYAPDLMTREALRFLDGARDRPFFLYLAPINPHKGNGRVVPDFGPYADAPWPERDRERAALITRLDEMVGAVLARLEANGLARNTVVMFSSDNGHPPDASPLFEGGGPLRGGKRDLYEGGIRVPLIVRWPGVVAPGSTSDHVGYLGDLMATLAELAGAPVPAGVDSISFLPTLRGQPAAQRQHDHLYWEFYEKGSAQAVRFGRWKAVRAPLGAGPLELYDLESDLGEARDLAARHPEVVARAEALMQAARVADDRWRPRGQPGPPALAGDGRARF